MRRTLLALALLAALPASARAATVTTELYMECNGDPACAKYQAGSQEVLLTFRADPGELNRVTLAPAGDGRARIVDDGAPLKPGPTCQAVTPNEILCPFPRAAIVELGDGDDTAAIALGPKTYADGGDGADVLTGSPANERLDGGPGADRLDGGAGDDVLLGSLAGEAGDALDGGDGSDLVSYEERGQAIIVALAGAPSNPDALTRVEGLRGGAGDDVLTGTAQPDRLFGGDGEDEVRGAGGADHVEGGEGNDRLFGGGGGDVLASYDGTFDELSCGRGADRVLTEIDVDDVYTELAWRGADESDVLGRSCERTALRGFPEEDPVEVDPRVRLRGSVAIVRNPCATLKARPCRGTVYVGTAFARMRKRFRAGSQYLRVRMRGRPAVPVRMQVRVRDGQDEHGGGWMADPRRRAG